MYREKKRHTKFSQHVPVPGEFDQLNDRGEELTSEKVSKSDGRDNSCPKNLTPPLHDECESEAFPNATRVRTIVPKNHQCDGRSGKQTLFRHFTIMRRPD